MQSIVVSKIIVLNEAGQVLLIRRSETDVRRPLEWDVPGGHTEDDEYPNEGAVRELFEETGIQFAPRKLKLVYATSANVSDSLCVTWPFFMARVPAPEVVLSHEHTEYCWAPLDEAIEKLNYERQKVVLQYIRDHQLAQEV